MAKMSEAKIDAGINLLVMGASGSGKTHFIGTLCKLVPTLVLTGDAVRTADTLKTMGVDPEFILVKDWEAIWEHYQAIKTFATSHNGQAALAIDDLGKVQGVTEGKAYRAPHGSKEFKQATGDEVAWRDSVRQSQMLGERRLQLQDWETIRLGLGAFLQDVLYKVPFRVRIVTCLEQVDENPRTGLMHVYPDIRGGFRRVLPSLFSFVGETAVMMLDGKRHYVLSTHSHPFLETKNCYQGGNRLWENPSLEKVLLHMNSNSQETLVEKALAQAWLPQDRKLRD